MASCVFPTKLEMNPKEIGRHKPFLRNKSSEVI